jgi:hypothetical protein
VVPVRSPLLALGSLLLLTACGGDDLTQPGTGTVEITTSTSGPGPDPDGYTFDIDGGPNNPIEPSTTVRLDLPAGSHTVRLAGVAANCTVADNPRSVTIAGGQTTTVPFVIACTASSTD